MAIITTGKTFGTTDAVTSVDLNNVANAATFNDPVDETSLEVITSGTNIGKLQIKDAGVTKAKIENVANLRVLGNTSGSSVAPQEVEILDDDTMATADATTLATSESIKAYVDATAVFTKSFVSSDQTFPGNNTEVSVAHSLGEVPKIIQVFAKITASVSGYASGDFVLINSGDAPGTGNAVAFCTSSNVGFYRNGSIRIASRSGSGVPLTLSSSNCSLVLKAFA